MGAVDVVGSPFSLMWTSGKTQDSVLYTENTVRQHLLAVSILIVFAAAAAWNYHTYFIAQDYVVLDYVSCDPASEACFAEMCEEDAEECDDTQYKKMEKRAWTVPACARDDEECLELSCEPGEEACIVTYCSEDTLEDGEVCVEPETEELEEAGEESVEDMEDGQGVTVI